MKYSFHPSAKDELNEAVSYYEEFQTGLGFEFAKEVYDTIQRVIQFPEAWLRLSENTRRCLVNRFPFGVIYQIKSDKIYIISIMHMRKKPDSWKLRLSIEG